MSASSRFAGKPDHEILTALVAAAIELAASEKKSCAVTVAQLDHQRRAQVLDALGEADAWRWCAQPALANLIDSVEALVASTAKSANPEPPEEPQPELPLTGGCEAL